MMQHATLEPISAALTDRWLWGVYVSCCPHGHLRNWLMVALATQAKRRMMSIAKCFYTARACNGAFNPEALEGSFDGLRKYSENP